MRAATISRKTPNAADSLRLSSECASRAPAGATSHDTGAMIANPGRLTQPMVHGGIAAGPGCANRYPTVAGTLIHKPSSAAVPTALWTGSPQSVIDGTLRVPPPIPIIAEIAPIVPGMAAPARPPGIAGRSTT